MATEVGSGFVSIIPSARGFGRQLSQEIDGPATAAGDSAGRKSGGRFKSGFGGALVGLAKTVGIAVAAVSIAAGGVGLKTAAQMETANISFTTMLGSAQKSRVFLEELKGFAAKTPFELPGLQTAASSLISAGVNAKHVIPIMTTLGDVTSGMGTGSEGIKRATVALQQMNAAGRITAEDLNQLRDAGVPVYDLLAAATGKSKAKVTELASAGKLGRKELGQLMKALESGKGLERFNGLMEKQSQSLTGLWSTLKDTFSVGMADAIQPLVPLIKTGLGSAISFVAGNIPRMTAGVAKMVVAAQGLYALLVKGDFSSKFREAFGVEEDAPIVGTLLHIRDVAISLKDQIPGAFASIKAAVVNLFPKDAGGGIDFAATIAKIEEGARTLWPQVKEAASQLKGIGPIVSVTGAVFGFLADHIGTLIKYLPLLIAAFVAMKTAQALGNVAAIAALPIQAAQVVSNFALAAALRASATAATTSAGQQVAASGAIQVSAARTAASAVLAGVRVVASWVMMGVQSLLNAARMAAAWLIAMGPIGWVIVAVVALVALIIANWDKVKKFTAAAWGWIVGKLKAAALFIVALFMKYHPVGIILSHWTQIKTGVSRIVGGLISFVKGIPGRILSALGKLGSLLLSAGADLVRGFINGIKNMAGAAVDAAKNMARSAVNAAKDFLHIGSPSKVFVKIGGQVVDGFALGITSAQVRAAKAAGSLAQAVTNAVKRQLPKIRARLAEVVSASRDMARGIADSVRGSFDITSVGGGAAGVIETLTGQIAKAKEFAAALTTLKKKGLSTSLLTQLGQAGPGSGAASDLAGASAAEIKKINSLVSQLSATGNRVGAFVADANHAATIKSLERQERLFEKALKSRSVMHLYDSDGRLMGTLRAVVKQENAKQARSVSVGAR